MQSSAKTQAAGLFKSAGTKPIKISSEVFSGITMCIISVCTSFMTMQVISTFLISGAYGDATQAQVATNGEIIAALWFVSMLFAGASSIAMGLIARLPLVQVSGLGCATAISIALGATAGLTFYNVLFLSLVGALIYTALAAIPLARRTLLEALPKPVRQALPVACGLLVAYVALQLSGLVSVSGSGIAAYGTATVLDNVPDAVALSRPVSWGLFNFGLDKYYPLTLIVALACVLTLVAFVVAKRRSRHPYGWALLVGTAFFLVTYIVFVCFNISNGRFSADSLWSRLWMVGGEDAQHYHFITGAIFQHLSVGKVLSEGTNFSAMSAAGGNVVVFSVGYIATYVLFSLASTLAVGDVTLEALKQKGAKAQSATGRILLVNALSNVVAPLVGASPVSVSLASYAGVQDKAHSSLAAIVCAAGYLVSAFLWIIPALFATITSYAVTFNMVGHYGFVMQLMSQTGFAVVDVVCVLIGLNMAAQALAHIEWQKYSSVAAVLMTCVASFATSNVAAGVCAGTIAYVLAEATRKRKAVIKLNENPSALKRIGVPTLALCAVSVVVLLGMMYL